MRSPLVAAALLVAALLAPAAAHAGTDGDPANGRTIFLDRCGACHRLADAGTQGTYGPNLDGLSPSYAQVLAQVTSGGGGMPPFAGQLDAQEIRDVAAYVWRAARTRLAPARPPRLPAGFSATLAARLDAERPTSLLPRPDGSLYIGTAKGRILRLVAPDAALTVASDGYDDAVLGLAPIGADTLVVADAGRVSTAAVGVDGALAAPVDVVTGLPVGLHQNAGVSVRRGRIWLSIGSTCNACRERDPRSATISSVLRDGSGFRIEARGLRDAFEPVWDARGRLWATDTGRNDRLDVADELNRVRSGARYGWPRCPGPRAGAGRCAGTLPPVMRYAPRSTPAGAAFAPAAFDAALADDLFVAQWGSYVAGVTAGRQVSRTDFRNGWPARALPFATGLVRPIDVAFAADGAMLVADYGSGAIWRIARSDAG